MTAVSPPKPGSRRRWVIWGLLAFAAIVGASVALGFIGHSEPSTVIVNGKTITSKSSSFDWELWALVLTGLGTTALAIATGLLAFSTWKDVRASQEIAQEARDANELARVEQARRPELTLLRDEERIYSRVEGDGNGYVRLLVHNESGRRAARGTRVIVPQYESWMKRIIALGSPSLGWTSAPDAADGSLVIFAGSSRAFDLGFLFRRQIGRENDRVAYTSPGRDAPEIWSLKLALHDLSIVDMREYLVPGPCVVRLVVGADEAEAREYDVTILWNGNLESAQDALDSVEIEIAPVGES